MKFPTDFKYTKDHEWVKVDGGVGTVGITNFAQSELGDLVFVDLPAPGKVMKRGQTMCVVESTKAASDVYAPVSGVVKEVNASLKDSPELVNKDPHGSGWMVKLEKIDATELGALMDAASYEKFLNEKGGH